MHTTVLQSKTEKRHFILTQKTFRNITQCSMDPFSVNVGIANFVFCFVFSNWSHTYTKSNHIFQVPRMVHARILLMKKKKIPEIREGGLDILKNYIQNCTCCKPEHIYRFLNFTFLGNLPICGKAGALLVQAAGKVKTCFSILGEYLNINISLKAHASVILISGLSLKN